MELAGILAFALLGGALADARDRRAMVLVTEAAMMATTLALVGNALLREPMTWVLFVMVGAAAAVDSIQRPSLDALIPRLVERDGWWRPMPSQAS